MPAGRRRVGRSYFGARAARGTGLSSRKGRVADEAHVPAEQPAPEAGARLPRAHGDTRRAKRAKAAAAQRPQAVDRAGAAEGRAAIASGIAAQARPAEGPCRRAGGCYRIAVRQEPTSAPAAGVLGHPATRTKTTEPEFHRRLRRPVSSSHLSVRIQRQSPRRQRGGAQPSQAASAGIRAASPPWSAAGSRFRRHRQARRGQTLLCGTGRRAASAILALT